MNTHIKGTFVALRVRLVTGVCVCVYERERERESERERARESVRE